MTLKQIIKSDIDFHVVAVSCVKSFCGFSGDDEVFVHYYLTLSFNANGGSGAMSDMTIATDESVNLTANTFTRVGYTFKGWATSASGSVAYADGASYKMGTNSLYTLYAVWEANNTLSFNANGGSGSMSNMTIPTDESKNLTPNAFTKAGYTFKGWATSANGDVVYQNGANYTMGTNSSYTLYAVWEAINYDIFYNLNGGTNGANPSTYTVESTDVLKAPTKENYEFLGWYNGDEVITTLEGHYGNLTLTAKYRSIFEYSQNTITGLTAYGKANYTTLVIPSEIDGNSITSIGDDAFYGCKSLTSVTIPNSVTSIGDAAFYECTSLTSVTIGNSVTLIGDWAFQYCTSLTSVTIPDSVTSIGYDAFRGCTSLTSVTIGNRVTSIGDDAFYGCKSLTSVTIPNSVTSIGDDAFYGCTSLTSVTIGNSVTLIGEYAFRNCTSLTIYCEVESKPSGWNSDWNSSRCPVVWDCNNNEVASDGYIYTVIDGIRYGIKDSVAMVEEQPTYIKEAIISESITYKGTIYRVTSIGEAAFLDCISLASVTIPNSVTSIGDYAFKYCTSLTSITIPNSVTSIGYGAFSYCTSLTSVTIPNSVTSIDWYAFSYCISLTIYCEAESRPGGWISSWNDSNRPVVWGHTHSYTNGECVCGAKQN